MLLYRYLKKYIIQYKLYFELIINFFIKKNEQRTSFFYKNIIDPTHKPII